MTIRPKQQSLTRRLDDVACLLAAVRIFQKYGRFPTAAEVRFECYSDAALFDLSAASAVQRPQRAVQDFNERSASADAHRRRQRGVQLRDVSRPARIPE